MLEVVEPIYDDLADPELLSKCLNGFTQNANESLKQLIWNRCMKEVWVSKKTVEQGVALAVAHFNDGSRALLNVLNIMGIVPGYFTTKACHKSDTDRINKSKKKFTDKQKQRRKTLRAIHKGYIDRNEQKEGVTYEAGAF